MQSDSKQLVLTLLQNGNSCHKVAAQTHLSYSTVRRIYSSISDTLPRQCGGCPTKLSPQDRRVLVQKITSGAVDTATKLKNTLNLDVCVQAISNTLRKEGLRSAVRQKKPFLSRARRKARLDFALEHQHWTMDDWKRVVWSDEIKINRLGSDGRLWVWKKQGSEQPVKGQ
jgi:transposase